MQTKLIKVAAIIALFVIGASLLSYKGKNDSASTATPQTKTESNPSAEDQNDQAEGKRVLERFIVSYNSYRFGDTSNIILLYPVMCKSLETSEKAKVEILQRQFSTYDDYVSTETQSKKSEVESYTEDKMIIKVTIEKTTLNGAFIPNKNGTSGSYVDKNGQTYTGSKNSLIEKTETETYRVTGIKESSDWKVCEFQKINS